MIYQPNPIMIFIAALVPVIIGFIWYHPKVLGTALARQTEKEVVPYGIKDALINYVFGVLLSFALLSYVNHQMAVLQLFLGREGFGEEGSQAMQDFEQVARLVGDYHLTMGHGAVHGIMAAVVYLLPVIVAMALRERRSYKFVLIHFGFWVISVAIMGALMGGFGLTVNL